MGLDTETLLVILLGLVSLILLIQLFQKSQSDEARLDRVERKLDAVLKAMNIAAPNPWDVMDESWKALATQPDRKIEAIKRLREQTGLGLAEAKAAVEDYQRSQSGNNP